MGAIAVRGAKVRHVFTLWPSGGAAASDQGLDADGMPLWASGLEGCAPPPRWTGRDWTMSVLIVALVAALALIVPADLASSLAAAGLAVLAIGLAIAGLFFHRRKVAELQRRLDESLRWNETIFERSGIALWREDWSEARDAVLRLLRSGVRDMQAYFAAHPDELRAIRRAVIIKDVNGFAVERSGASSKDQLLGSLDRILPDTDQTFVQWLVAFARGDSLYRSETHLTAANGETTHTLFTAGLPTDMRGFQDILVSDLDITEYKATQERLARAEIEVSRAARVTTMGALSASIAHEVNSPLAAIISSAEATLQWLGREEPDLVEAAASVRNVLDAARRAKSVVESTRAFLSKSPTALGRHDMARLVHEAVRLVDGEIRALGASIHIDAIDGVPPVLVDAVNIQQVVVNLVLNAAQAMSTQSGPRDITISVRPDDARVRVEVSDKGAGIGPAAMKTMFDPFFSTKPGGMGMGLAICRTCISAYGGRLWATSSVGEGSTFHFDLPAAIGEQHD